MHPHPVHNPGHHVWPSSRSGFFHATEQLHRTADASQRYDSIDVTATPGLLSDLSQDRYALRVAGDDGYTLPAAALSMQTWI
jgi:hypothetical protein